MCVDTSTLFVRSFAHATRTSLIRIRWLLTCLQSLDLSQILRIGDIQQLSP